MNKKDSLKKINEEIIATKCYIINIEFMQEKEKDIKLEYEIQKIKLKKYVEGLEFAKKILTI